MPTKPRSLPSLVKLALLLFGVLVAAPAWAWDMTVAWDPNPPSENVTGYTLYYGKVSRTAPGFSAYSSQVNVGNVLQRSLALPDDGATYYLAVVAYNGAGQSAYSAEISAAPTAPAPATSDTTPPAVTISSPDDGSSISKVLKIKVDAADGGPIERLEAYAGDKQLGSLNCQGASTCSGSFSWNTVKGVANGRHTITAHAYDASANRGVSTITVYKTK